MPALRVFLDSSDYSVLSGTEATKAPYASILETLVAYRDANAVAFYFTGPLVAEMAPIDSRSAPAAIARGALLAALCGRNCLVSPERLIAHEVASALGLARDPRDLWSETGDWFPGGALDIIKISPEEHRNAFHDVLTEQGANRAARRQAQRKMMKQGQFRPATQARIAQAVRSDQAAIDIQKRFPMCIEDARTLARFVAGAATPDQAAAAFCSSLGDPSGLYAWMSHQPEGAKSFLEWVRGPAAGLSKSVLQLADLATKLRELELNSGVETGVDGLSGSDWKAQSETALKSMAGRFAMELLNQPTTNLSTNSLEANCPGLVCAVRTMYEAWRTALLAQPRKPKDSDFPDMLHALYAPYVDLFRADGFMAPIIARHNKDGRVRVIAKLTQLPAAIESVIGRV